VSGLFFGGWVGFSFALGLGLGNKRQQSFLREHRKYLHSVQENRISPLEISGSFSCLISHTHDIIFIKG